MSLGPGGLLPWVEQVEIRCCPAVSCQLAPSAAHNLLQVFVVDRQHWQRLQTHRGKRILNHLYDVANVSGILDTIEVARMASRRNPNNWYVLGIGIEKCMDGLRTWKVNATILFTLQAVLVQRRKLVHADGSNFQVWMFCAIFLIWSAPCRSKIFCDQ